MKKSQKVQSSSTPTASPKPPVWLRPGWRGPRIEVRPKDAGPEWPENAVERVVFRPEDSPRIARMINSPFTQHFSADGWPLSCPEHVKPQLDPRMKAEFHSLPWSHSGAWSEKTWLNGASDFDRQERLNIQAGVISSKRFRSLGVPSPGRLA